jgi:DNA polymerase-3 subunit delta'
MLTEQQDWLSLLPALNSDQAVERLHWLASCCWMRKIQQGQLLTNPDAWPLVNTLANRLSGRFFTRCFMTSARAVNSF